MLTLFDRFASERHALVQRMAQDQEFYALCQDYEICVDVLRYWKASSRPEANARIDEYRTLVCDLEAEIALSLQSSEPADRR